MAGAATKRTVIEAVPPKRFGTRISMAMTARTPPTTVFNERSRSVLSCAGGSPGILWFRFLSNLDFTSPTPIPNDLIIVGTDRTIVIIPPNATAPAPM